MENIRSKIHLIILILFIISIVFSNVIFAATGTVTADSVRIRKEPSTTSEVLSVVTDGEKFEVLAEEGDWYKISFEDLEGYISKKLVKTDFVATTTDTTPTTTEEPNTLAENTEAPVNTDTTENSNPIKNTEITIEKEASIRSLPSFISKSTSNIAAGTKVQVVDELNRWIKITDENVTGWVIKENVVTSTTTTEPPVTNNTTTTTGTPTTTPDATTESKSGHISVESARIRETPNGTVIDVVDINDKVEILSEEDGWYKINVGGYKGCYISTKLVKLD